VNQAVKTETGRVNTNPYKHWRPAAPFEKKNSLEDEISRFGEMNK